MTTRTRGSGLSIGLMALLLVAACGDGKDSEKRSAPPDTHKAVPDKPVKRDRPQVRGRATQVEGEELFTLKVERAEGEVKVVTRPPKPSRRAEGGELVHAGGEVATGADGRAEVVVRTVGVITLGSNSRLLVAPHGECGTILLRGAAHLQGSRRVPKRQRCLLHTPSAAISSPRSEAVVAVAADGRTRVGALVGTTKYIDLLGAASALEPGKRVDMSSAGVATGTSAFTAAEGEPVLAFAPWLAEHADAPAKTKPWVKRLLDDASRVSERLKLDVERLQELMELNRKNSAQRRALVTDPDAPENLVAGLTKLLADQSAEMVDLQIKGVMQIHRIVAIAELVRQRAADDAEAVERAAALGAGLDELAKQLPPLFEKKRKVSGKGIGPAALMPSGPNPKRPK